MNEVLSFYIKLFSTFTFRAPSQPPRFGSARCITGEKSLNIKQNLEKNTENDLLVFSEMGPHSRGMGGKVRLTWNHLKSQHLMGSISWSIITQQLHDTSQEMSSKLFV